MSLVNDLLRDDPDFWKGIGLKPERRKPKIKRLDANHNSLNPRARFEAAAILLAAHSHRCPACREYWGCTSERCVKRDEQDRPAERTCHNCADPLMIRTDQGAWYDLRYVRLRPIENGKGYAVWMNNKPVRLGLVTRAADKCKCAEYLK